MAIYHFEVMHWFTRHNFSLIPGDSDSEYALSRLVEGEMVQVDIKKPRSIKFNRLYWSCCKQIGLQQDPPRDAESISDEIKILSGHYTVLKIAGVDYEIRSPKRINFSSMSVEKWNEYYIKADQIMLERFNFDSSPHE